VPPAKRIAIVQSSYIPWKGYFDLMNSVDEFVLFDDVQFTRRDWRNRNRIKTTGGLQWLTIPVASKGHYLAPISSMSVSDPEWARRHWKSIVGSYARAPFFRAYAPAIEEMYLGCTHARLSDVNRRFLAGLADMLGIQTRLLWSSDFAPLASGKTERLLGICHRANAEVYVSGPSAAAYIDAEQFRDAGVDLRYFAYDGYPEYHQLFPPFEHRVSVIDLILNEGPNATRFMLTF
jgi:hypothetical protein